MRRGVDAQWTTGAAVGSRAWTWPPSCPRPRRRRCASRREPALVARRRQRAARRRVKSWSAASAAIVAGAGRGGGHRRRRVHRDDHRAGRADRCTGDVSGSGGAGCRRSEGPDQAGERAAAACAAPRVRWPASCVRRWPGWTDTRTGCGGWSAWSAWWARTIWRCRTVRGLRDEVIRAADATELRLRTRAGEASELIRARRRAAADVAGELDATVAAMRREIEDGVAGYGRLVTAANEAAHATRGLAQGSTAGALPPGAGPAVPPGARPAVPPATEPPALSGARPGPAPAARITSGAPHRRPRTGRLDRPAAGTGRRDARTHPLSRPSPGDRARSGAARPGHSTSKSRPARSSPCGWPGPTLGTAATSDRPGRVRRPLRPGPDAGRRVGSPPAESRAATVGAA